VNLRKLPFVLGFDAKAGGTGCKVDKEHIPSRVAVDDLRIYNRALSAGEIKVLFDAGGLTPLADPRVTTAPVY